MREQVLREQPLCQICGPTCTLISTTVDHVLPLRDYPQLRYVRANLRGSCAAVHDSAVPDPPNHHHDHGRWTSSARNRTAVKILSRHLSIVYLL